MIPAITKETRLYPELMSQSAIRCDEKSAVARLVEAANPTQQKTPTSAPRVGVTGGRCLITTASDAAMSRPQMNAIRRSRGIGPEAAFISSSLFPIRRIHGFANSALEYQR